MTDFFSGKDELAPKNGNGARALGFVHTQTGPHGKFTLALQVWAEAQRDPVLADFVAEKYTTIRQHFVAAAGRARDTGELPPGADVAAIGAVLFGMLPGYALQRILAEGPDKDTYLQGVKALMLTARRCE